MGDVLNRARLKVGEIENTKASGLKEIAFFVSLEIKQQAISICSSRIWREKIKGYSEG